MDKNEIINKIKTDYPEVYKLINLDNFNLVTLRRKTKIAWRKDLKLVMYLNDQLDEEPVISTRPRILDDKIWINDVFEDLIKRGRMFDAPSLLICLYYGKEGYCAATQVYVVKHSDPAFNHIRSMLRDNQISLNKEWKKITELLCLFKRRVSEGVYNSHIETLKE